ncbi:MAG: DUF4169 family protein [Bartonella sp.]|nr:DUF4169 family protein [Bartonella sp.]
MAELINLRQFRKKKTREKHEEEAQQNRILFGRTKVEKEFDERLKAKNIQQIKLGKLSDTEE